MEYITPDRARRDLEAAKGKNYRQISDHWVEKLADDFINGRHELTYKPIEYDKDGILHDGQHRLMAVIQSGMTLPFFVVYGSEPTTCEGNVKKRCAADHLAHAGAKNKNETAATIQLLILWMDGNMKNLGSDTASTSEVMAAYELFPEIETYVEEARKVRFRGMKGCSATSIALAGFVSCTQTNTATFNQLTKFVDEIKHGTGEVGSATRWLHDGYLSGKYHGQKVRTAVVIKAWNAFRKGKKLARLTYSLDEKFPEIE